MADYPQKRTYDGPQWFADLLRALQRNFSDKNLLDAKLQDWWESCQEHLESDIRRAVQRVKDDPERQFFPTWGQFRRHLPRLAHEPNPSSFSGVSWDALFGSWTGDPGLLSAESRKQIAAEVERNLRMDKPRVLDRQLEMIEAFDPERGKELRSRLVSS